MRRDALRARITNASADCLHAAPIGVHAGQCNIFILYAFVRPAADAAGNLNPKP